MQQQVKSTYAATARAWHKRALRLQQFLHSRRVWIVLCTLIVWLQSAATAAAHPNLQQGDGTVTTLADVRQAVIQIEAVGTFRDPDAGIRTGAAGRGSGFIIDPSGLAVTNNHVVTGAAYLQVYVAGEEQPRNARVLGVSECSDLAVIDIEGDGFPYLTWYPDPIQVALNVYAAGFPLGDPEYTLTDGIVAKERANGDSSWASVDGVIQHSAIINPGNSGGPLVDSQGRVVAVNYAGVAGIDQYFAISRDTALHVIETLRQGKDLNSLGINGRALVFGDNDEFSGIWVSSIKSGSPAGQAGLQPGDFILEIEGIRMATDGTMAGYCDILRSHGDNDVLNLKVARFDTEELLTGQIRGRPLTPISMEPSSPTPTATRPATAATGYQAFEDRSGTIRFERPNAWQEIEEQAMTDEGEQYGVYLAVSPDLDHWRDGWQTPGIALVVSTAQHQAGIQSALLEFLEVAAECDPQQYLDELQTDTLSGTMDIWPNCAGESVVALSVALTSPAHPLAVVAVAKLINEDDIEAIFHLLETLTLAYTPARPTATTTATPRPPTPQLTPTPPPTQDVTVLFQDEFVSNVNEWPTGPFSSEFSEGEQHIENGRYAWQTTFKQDAVTWEWLPGVTAKNFLLSFEAAIADTAGDPEPQIVIIYRSQAGTLGIVEFTADGGFRIRERYDDEMHTVQEQESSDLFTLRTGETNRFDLLVHENFAMLRVNETFVTSIDTIALSNRGELGIGVAGRESGSLSVHYDNLFVLDTATLDLDLPTPAQPPTATPRPRPTATATPHPTATDRPRPTATPVILPTNTPTPVPPTATVLPTATLSPTPMPTTIANTSEVQAIVRIAELPVYAEPSTAAAPIGRVGRMEELAVIGQADQCRWLQVNYQGTAGWVSGLRRNVAVVGDCDALPEQPVP